MARAYTIDPRTGELVKAPVSAYQQYGPSGPSYPVKYTLAGKQLDPYDLVPRDHRVWLDEVKWETDKEFLYGRKPEPPKRLYRDGKLVPQESTLYASDGTFIKVRDNRRWERPYSYPIARWNSRRHAPWSIREQYGPMADTYYFEDWAAELEHEHWLNDVKARLGLVTSERGCIGIRPKPELGAAWDALVEKWGPK